MINKETIISVFDDKLTLMQWLKKVEDALNGAVLTGVELKKKGNATFAWSFDFEDGTHVDTEYVTINEGESVAEAYLLNGHLMIKLTNDEVIDAGNLKPVTSFSFNSQRHLIVYYGDGTTEDLGLIKGVSSFTIDANQHLIVNYDNGTSQDLGSFGDFSNVDFVAKTIEQTQPNFDASIPLAKQTHVVDADLTEIYNRFQLFNRRLSIIVNFKLTNNTENDMTIYAGDYCVGRYQTLPSSIASKIFDIVGNSVAQANAGAKLITAVPVVVYDGETSSSATEYRDFTLWVENNNATNTLWLGIRHFNSSFVFRAGKSYYFTARLILDL